MKYTVGQEVRIFEGMRQRRDEIAEGRPGKVTHVGRKLVTVLPDGSPFDAKYRMGTGRKNDGYGHEFILTLDEVEERNQRIMINARLIGLGVNFRLGFEEKYSTDQLAAVIKVLEEEQ